MNSLGTLTVVRPHVNGRALSTWSIEWRSADGQKACSIADGIPEKRFAQTMAGAIARAEGFKLRNLLDVVEEF